MSPNNDQMHVSIGSWNLIKLSADLLSKNFYLARVKTPSPPTLIENLQHGILCFDIDFHALIFNSSSCRFSMNP